MGNHLAEKDMGNHLEARQEDACGTEEERKEEEIRGKGKGYLGHGYDCGEEGHSAMFCPKKGGQKGGDKGGEKRKWF